MSDVNAINGLLTRADEIVKAAEEHVLIPELHTKTVVICKKTVDLRPLPISYAKKWSRKFRDVIKLSGSTNEADVQRWREEADDMICDALCECVAMLKDFYEIPGKVTIEEVQEMMTINEVKGVVAAQAKLNEDDDFLLMPLRHILFLLSASSPAENLPVNPTPVSSQPEGTQSSMLDS